MIKVGNIIHVNTTKDYGDWEDLMFLITSITKNKIGETFYFEPLNHSNFPYGCNISTRSDLFTSKFVQFKLVGNLETHPEYFL